MADIAIIIPIYNSAKTIEDCLTSINNQHYAADISVYLIDDCSSDNSVELVNNFNFNENVKAFFYNNITNKKQGFSRNRMLNEIVEDYVVFLDSDDMLHPEFISRALPYLVDNECHIVYTGWIYYHDQNKTYNYNLMDKVLENDFLIGDECSNILSFKTYFSTPAIYSTVFLKKYHIRFGEGYWYEDYEFFVNCAMKAKKIGLYHYPLYIVRVHESSTTKTNYDTDVHYRSFSKAVQNSLNHLYKRNELSIFYFYSCVLQKMNAYEKRGRSKSKKVFINNCLELLKKNSDYQVKRTRNRFLNFFFYKNGIENKRVNYYLMLRYARDKKVKCFKKINDFKTRYQRKGKIKANKIVFVGFDFKNKGNSKYLAEYLKKEGYDVSFLTEKELYSKAYYRQLNEAKLIVLESWNRLKYQKKSDQIYLQLWHGSPYKKMFFDSNEKYVVQKNRKYRCQKHHDYHQWDYLLCENEEDAKLFEHAFCHHKYQSLIFGYPRYKWLIDHNNEEYITKLREKYQLTKPLILYLPTWRDKQLFGEEKDFLLDVSSLKEQFSEYCFYESLHPYLNDAEFEFEVDELLLLADLVISDYSSIVYDALKLNKKVLLYQKDRQEYQEYRGLYHKRDQFFIDNKIIVEDGETLVSYLKNFGTIPNLDDPSPTNYENIYEKFKELLKEVGIFNGEKK